MSKLEACIFDLDGVLVDTAKYHYTAWHDLAQEFDIELTTEENEKLKGVSRRDSLIHILNLGGKVLTEDEINHWCEVKNTHYLELIAGMDADELLPDVIRILDLLKDNAIKIGLGSASKNAPFILEKTNIAHYFQSVVCGLDVINSKPHPEVFLKGAEQLDVDPSNCIVFEDSIKGIIAANTGGFISVGVGDPEELNQAAHNIKDFTGLTLKSLQSLFS